MSDHSVTFYAEDGEFVARCSCGWEDKSQRSEVNVTKLIGTRVLAGILHTDRRAPELARTSAEASA